MTDYKATPEQWADVGAFASDTRACIFELRSRIEQLEAAAHKHIVETNSNIVALFTRVESLEAAERQASKVYEINKPLKLTAKQQEQLNVLLRPATSQPSPNSSQVGSSLVDRVSTAIALEDEKHYWPEARDAVETDMARAAILEVAAWMTSNPDVYFPPALVFAIEQEVER
jgi:hypothetical protein